ncbi:hypothetical protein BH11PSE4_BH11PSE4_12080 [soil metagenome]
MFFFFPLPRAKRSFARWERVDARQRGRVRGSHKRSAVRLPLIRRGLRPRHLLPQGEKEGRGESRYQRSCRNFSAAAGAKYVSTPSAPARLKPSRLSIMARSPAIQPLVAAAMIIAYSPDTW